TAFTAYSADMNRAPAPVTSIEEMSLNRLWAAPRLPRLSFNQLAVSSCTLAGTFRSAGGGGERVVNCVIPTEAVEDGFASADAHQRAAASGSSVGLAPWAVACLRSVITSAPSAS